MRRLKRNAAKCNDCGEIVESRLTHEMRGCACFRAGSTKKGVAVDGGHAYQRVLFGTEADFEDLSEWEDEEDEKSSPAPCVGDSQG